MMENFFTNNSGIVNKTLDDGLCHRHITFENENTPHLFIVLNSTANIILMIVSIIANSLVIAAVWKTPSLRYPSILFLCNLALSDVIVGLVVEPLFITVELLKLHGYPKGDNCRLQTAFITIGRLVGEVSFATVTLTSVDRFLAIHYPLRYDTIVTNFRAYFIVISCWVVCAFCSSLNHWSWTAYSCVVVVFMAVFLGISTVIQIKIYRIVRRHRREIQAQEQAVHITHHFNLVQFTKSCVNTFLVYCVVLLCYLPFFIVCILSSIEDKVISPLVWKLVHTAMFLNSALNPFLYCWRLPAIRGPVMLLVRKIFCSKKVTMR